MHVRMCPVCQSLPLFVGLDAPDASDRAETALYMWVYSSTVKKCVSRPISRFPPEIRTQNRNTR